MAPVKKTARKAKPAKVTKTAKAPKMPKPAKKGRQVRKKRSTCKIDPENRLYPEWDNDLFMTNGAKRWTEEQCAHLWARRLNGDTYKEIQKTLLRTELAMRLKCHHMVDDAQKAGAEGPFPIVGAKPKKGQLWIDETPVAVAPAAQKDDDAVSSASNISAEPTPEPEAAQAPVASSAPEVEMAPVATPVPVAVTAPVAMSVRQAAKAPVATPTPFSTTAPVALPVSQAVTAPVATPAPSASTAAPPSRATEADALEGLMMLSQAGAMHRDEGENRMATRQSSHYRCTIDYLVHH